MEADKKYFTSDEIRPLARRSNIMGLILILHCYLLIVVALLMFFLWSNFLTFFLAIVIIGSRQLGLAILMHDAAHRALFARKSFNDFLGFWVCGCPILADLFSYRRFHLMHHKYTQTEKDPDKVLSRPFPVTQLSLFRKFLRDLTGQTGVKLFFRQLLDSYRLAFDKDAISNSSKQPQTFKASSLFRPLISNFFIFIIMGYLGAWWWWFAFWLLPLFTWFQIVVRIRNIAEHAATEFTSNELQNVRTTYASPLMRLFVAPYWVNYHLEHHLIMHVPCWRLPKVHELMIKKGYSDQMKLAKSYLEVFKEVTSKKIVSS